MARDAIKRHLRGSFIALVGILMLSACGSGSAAAPASDATLTIDAFNPFSGANASYGELSFAGCAPAASLINQAGGVMGHHLTCVATDNRGDPADAVLAAKQMISSTANVVGVLGPDSNSAGATISIFNGAKLPMFENGGDLAYKSGHFSYYWRTLPADQVEGYALAVWAHMRGYQTAAAVFGNDIAAQGNVPGLVAGAAHVGLKIVANETLAPDQTSYQTEVQRIVSAHPQVIFTETDPQTAAVFFRELKAVNGLVPVEVTANAQGPDYGKALAGALGKPDYSRYFITVGPWAATSGSSWKSYNDALLKAGSQVKNPAQYSTQSYSMAAYDDVNVLALAMDAAKSVQPVKFNSAISEVTAARPGAVVVSTYKAGKAALDAGKPIRYVGPTGPIVFDSSHNSPGEFAALTPIDYGLVAVIPTSAIVAAQR